MTRRRSGPRRRPPGGPKPSCSSGHRRAAPSARPAGPGPADHCPASTTRCSVIADTRSSMPNCSTRCSSVEVASELGSVTVAHDPAQDGTANADKLTRRSVVVRHGRSEIIVRVFSRSSMLASTCETNPSARPITIARLNWSSRQAGWRMDVVVRGLVGSGMPAPTWSASCGWCRDG
jgi:hypothetical protein